MTRIGTDWIGIGRVGIDLGCNWSDGNLFGWEIIQMGIDLDKNWLDGKQHWQKLSVYPHNKSEPAKPVYLHKVLSSIFILYLLINFHIIISTFIEYFIK